MINECAIVAVIDGDVLMRSTLRQLLEHAGLMAKLFESTEEYLRTSKSCAPNCIVLDPEADHLDLQAELAETNCPTPIVFVTANADIRMSVRAMKAGAVEYLTKPFRSRELLAAVESGIERDRANRTEYQALSQLRERFASLSPREQEIMTLLSAGRNVKQIAGQIGVCTHTARVHGNRAMAKMAARSIVDLVRMADKLGMRCELSSRSAISFRAACAPARLI